MRMKLRVLFPFVAASFLSSSAFAQLTAADVQTIINHAVTRAVQVSPNSVIAVTDREGYVLGIWNVAGDIRIAHPRDFARWFTRRFATLQEWDSRRRDRRHRRRYRQFISLYLWTGHR